MYKILIVDDEPFIVDTLDDVLFNTYNIIKAYNAKEALTLIKENKVDLIISDQRMPGMTGTELLKIINMEYPHIGKILLTGYSDISAAMDAINNGNVDKYLQKPWSNDELLQLIQEVIERKKVSAGSCFTSAKDDLKKTILFISENCLVPTPVCYNVVYEYATNRNSALTKELETKLKKAGRIDNLFIYELFDKYFKNDSEHIWEFSKGLEKVLNEILQQMIIPNAKIIDYKDTLSKHLDNLNSKHIDPYIIKDVILNVVQATKETHNIVNGLHENLESVRNEASKLRSELEKVKKSASTDMLTGLLNRNTLEEELMSTIENPKIRPFCILMVDIDHFKKVNDTYGHIVGDQVISHVGATVKKTMPETSIAGRYGGEELMVILKNTKLVSAVKVAEKIRLAIEKLKLIRRDTNEKIPSITVSVGVTQYMSDENREELIERADSALYLSKQSGRNKVTYVSNNQKSKR